MSASQPFIRERFNSTWEYWVAVKELKLSYHIGETLLFTIYAHYGNLNLSSLTATQNSVWLRSYRPLSAQDKKTVSKWEGDIQSYKKHLKKEAV